MESLFLHSVLLSLSLLVPGDPIAVISTGSQSSVGEPFADLVLPAFVFESKSVAEWTEQLADVRQDYSARSTALWSLFYHDKRTPEVLASLRHTLENETGGGGGPHRLISTSGSGTTIVPSSMRAALHREADAILDHWGVEHQCLNLKRYSNRGVGRGNPPRFFESEFYPLPTQVLPASTEELLGLLVVGEPESVVQAAVTLVARREHLIAAIQAMVRELRGSPDYFLATPFESALLADRDDPETLLIRALTWALAVTGSEGELALASLLQDPEQDLSSKKYVIDKLLGSRGTGAIYREPQGGGPLSTALLTLIESGVLVPGACRALFRLHWVGPPYEGSSSPSGYFSYRYPRTTSQDSEAGAALGRAVAALIEFGADDASLAIPEGVVTLCKEEGMWTSSSKAFAIDLTKLILIHNAVSSHPRVFQAAQPWLLSLLDRGGLLALMSLRLLCYCEDSSESVREAYLKHLKSVDRESDADLWRLPRLPVHDVETRAALLSLAREVGRVQSIRAELEWAGLLRTGGVHELLPALSLRWGEVDASTYQGPCDVEASDDIYERVAKYSFRARRRIAASEDPAPELEMLWEILLRGVTESGTHPNDYFEQAIVAVAELDADQDRMANWGIAELQDYFSTFSGHKEAILQALLGTELSRRQQAALCQIRVGIKGADWAALYARQGEASIERVVDLRHRAYANLSGMREVLLVTRLSALDKQMILDALKRGASRDREVALGLIGDFNLDFPGLRGAVQLCREDCDNDVRRAAELLWEAMGW